MGRRDGDTRPQADVSGRKTKPDVTERKPPRDETGAGFWGMVDRSKKIHEGESPGRLSDLGEGIVPKRKSP